jgi:hypothetical protein
MRRLAEGARDHAARFAWDRTADGLLVAYGEAVAELRSQKPALR